jgi:carbon monoxide dehydrogenase subunit G
MIIVDRSRHINATPEAIFAALSDPEHLAELLPRVRKIEFITRGVDQAHIATHMALGPFGDIRSEGDVRWQSNREIVFNTYKPVMVEARWTLTPANGGTDLHASLTLDLAPLIGPFAAFVPPEQVTRMIAPDLDLALVALAGRVEGLRERSVGT